MKRSACTPSLYAPDIPAAVKFYVETLGFSHTAQYKDEDGAKVIWSEVALGEARIWFFAHPLDDQPTPSFSGLVYVFVEDVDAVAEKIRGKATVKWGPETQAYGLRELGVADLNGYILVFAKDVV